MRDITNPQALEEQITRPVFLVRLDFSPPVYLSSAARIQWGGYTWEPYGVSVGRIALDSMGQADVAMRISNLDRTFGVLVLNQAPKDRTAKVYIHYPDGPIDPLELVDGVMDGARIGEYVDITVISRSTYYGMSPRVRCAPPTFNHMPPVGTVLRWGNTSIQLERR